MSELGTSPLSVTKGGTGNTSISNMLDDVAGSVVGTLLTRKISGWEGLTPGTSGNFLKSNGPGSELSFGGGGSGSGSLDIKNYGAVGNGVTDDTAAFLAWLSAINTSVEDNVIATLGSGNFLLASGTATSGLVITRDNVMIKGDGATITVTGTNVIPSVFQTDGMSNITYENIRFIGNSQADAFANGVAIKFVNYTGTSCSGFLVKNCYFDNFKGDYWVFAECIGTRSIANISICDNFAVSRTGNARGPAVITIASSFCGIFGSGDPNYQITNVLIENNIVYADYIKSGVIVTDQVYGFTIQNNTIWNAGQNGISNDCGAYAIQIYSNVPHTPGRYGMTVGNKIFSPRSIGIYQANVWNDSLIADNLIVSQGPDTLNATIPKGGIVLNGSTETTVSRNTIIATQVDAIWFNTSPTVNVGINISNNNIRGCARGIVFESSGGNNGVNISIQDNLIRDFSGQGIICSAYTGTITADLTIRNNSIQMTSASLTGIECSTPDATAGFAYFNIQSNTIRTTAGSGTGIKFLGQTVAQSAIQNNTLFGTFTATVTTTGSTGVTSANNLNLT